MTTGDADSLVPAGNRRSWKTAILITALAAGFVAARLPLWLWAPLEVYDDEELYNGTAARELMRGPKLSLENYMYYPHEGGALVVTAWIVPFFWIFGTSFAALKLAALSFSLLTFLVWVQFAQRFLGFAAAIWLALLWIAAPPLLLKSDLMAWGHHNSVNLLIAIAAFLLVAELTAGDSGSAKSRVAGLGFVCGFGMFFAYIFLPMLLACVFLLFIRGGRPRRGIGAFLVWFAVGFTPWLAVNLMTDFAGLEVFGRHGDGSFNLDEIQAKAIELLTVSFPISPNFADVPFLPAYALSRIYALTLGVCLLAGLGALRPGNHAAGKEPAHELAGNQLTRRVVAETAWLFLGLFLVVYLVSPFRVQIEWPASDRFVDFRYLLPMYPFLLLITAMVIASRVRLAGRLSNAWRGCAALLILGLGSWGIVHSVASAENRPSRAILGFSYERFGWRCFSRYAADPDLGVAVAERIDPLQVEDFYRGVGWGIAGVWPNDDAFSLWYAALPESFRHFAWEGLAWRVMDNSEGNVANAIQIGASIEEEYRPAYFRGVGWIIGKRFHANLDACIPLLATIPEEYRDAAYFGLGRVVGEREVFTGSQKPDLAPVAAKYQSSVESGAKESIERYEQGRFMDGLTYLRWGRNAFYTWDEME